MPITDPEFRIRTHLTQVRILNQKSGKKKSKFELYRHESGSQDSNPLEPDPDPETELKGKNFQKILEVHLSRIQCLRVDPLETDPATMKH